MARGTGRMRRFLGLAPAALIIFAVQAVRGQTPDTIERRLSNPPEFHFPTNVERVDRLLRDTFGPVAVLQSALVAGTHHIVNNPPEWRQGVDGYNRRLASQFGRLAVQNSLELSLGAALKQDYTYQRCNCRGFLRRTGHAVIANFTARTPDGGNTFTLVRVGSIYAGAMISTAWYPDRYTATGDGVRFGTVSVASGTLINIAREFWPDIRRFFHR